MNRRKLPPGTRKHGGAPGAITKKPESFSFDPHGMR